ncbi:MAG: thiolase family protein [Candidatus Omnitrophica bacterium]|nr:thiolase family protein [Candidatus Omnitrophota bacterium]
MSSCKLYKDIYIVDGLRTPVGSSLKSPLVIKELLKGQTNIKDKIDEVLLGNTVSAGTGQNIARQAIILSGLSYSTPGFVINGVCGSGLEAVIMACRAIFCDGMHLVLAGGSESASQCPSLVYDTAEPVDSLIRDGLWCNMSDQHMGQLAENLAKKHNVSKESQDVFSCQSHVKAVSAQEKNKFQQEIVPVKKADGGLVDKDDRPRKNISMERMGNLPSAFEEDGTVTAGNASSAADGAAVLLLASAASIKKYNLSKPKAKILGYASIALEPARCFEGAVIAVQESLKVCGLSLADIDLFEIGESFASQVIWTKDQLRIPDEKLNIYGGDIALGHPLGSTGARLLVTLLHALENENKKLGLVSLCFGSGGAISMVIERL